MTARVFQRSSKLAPWSRRFALFAAQLAILAALLHQLGVLSTPVATNLLAVAVGLALIALILAGIALVQIWRHGIPGTGHAVAGALLSLLILVGPLWYLPDLLMRPHINDITTNPAAPPRFQALAASRPADANRASYAGVVTAEQQLQAYPDIRPMTLEKSSQEVYDLVHEAVQRLGWEIVTQSKPTGGAPGFIEAVDKTLIMGYADDVAIGISAGSGTAQVDVRSASRYGDHDFGTNARRIRRLFAEVKAGLEDGEKRALEQVLSRRAKEAKEARARARQAKIEAERRARRREARRAARARAQSGAQGERVPRAPQRRGGGARDSGRFWQQFGN